MQKRRVRKWSSLLGAPVVKSKETRSSWEVAGPCVLHWALVNRQVTRFFLDCCVGQQEKATGATLVVEMLELKRFAESLLAFAEVVVAAAVEGVEVGCEVELEMVP